MPCCTEGGIPCSRANAEAIREAGKEGEIVFFMRAGWTGSSRYSTAFWAGDQLVNWSKNDGLPSVIPAAISLGFSGSGVWHSDIGGYTTALWVKRSRETLMRWAEMAAFTPIMRTHEGLRPDSNAQVWTDAGILAHFARMSSVWTGLAPYHAAVMAEYESAGLPPIRHTWLHYEDEAELRSQSCQYLYGRDILVAPVLKPGLELSDAYLPSDHWVHLWTSREFRGGEVTIEAPLGYPPVFYRADSPWASLFEGLRRSVQEPIRSTRITAWVSIASLRPAASTPSCVLALTETASKGKPSIAAIEARMASMYGASFGCSRMTVESTLTIRQPASASICAARSTNLRECASFHCGSEGGK